MLWLRQSRTKGQNSLMERPKADDTTYFSQPIRQIVTMLLACGLVAAQAGVVEQAASGQRAATILIRLIIRPVKGKPLVTDSA